MLIKITVTLLNLGVTELVFESEPQLGVFLTGHTVAMVTHYVEKMTGSPGDSSELSWRHYCCINL